MASIFFTGRLPGISNVVRLREVRVIDRPPMAGCCGIAGGSRTHYSLPLERDKPALASYSLPEKQGLCQVVNRLVLGTLSNF
jgi:hypothetical protein